MDIWVIFHDTFEDTNIFTTNFNETSDIIKKLSRETGTWSSEWNIRILQEGIKFNIPLFKTK